MNKKGLTTMGIFAFIFMVFIWIMLLGIFLLISNQVTTNLDINVSIGQVNLGETVQGTLGLLNTGFLNNADIIGAVIIFGMILTMFVNAYLFRGEYPQLFIIIDIVLLVFAYILAVYISNAYELLINSTPVLNLYIINLSKSSTFILRLPTFVSIIGVIIIILSYAGFPRDTEEEIIIGQM